ncbi:MAG: tetratricopeptide repeat protein [Candidatus Kariarchaeaceae archaeon]|jgi:tetratricopeptide (TPR) repeat protein
MLLRKIETLVQKGMFHQALEVLNSNNIDDEPDLVYLKCRLLIETGNIEDSLIYIQSAISADLIDFITKLKLYNEKGFCLWRLGKIEEGLDAISEALELISDLVKDEQDQYSLVQNLLIITKALIYSHIGKLEESIDLISTLDIHDRKNHVYAKYVLGIAFWKSGKTQEAISSCESAIKGAKEIFDHYLIYNCTIVLGNIHLDNDEFAKAKPLYEETLAISSKINDDLGKSISTINLAEIHRRQGNYLEALDMLTNIIKDLQKIGNLQNLALAMELMGLIYEDQGNLDLALTTHEKSYQYRIQLGNKQDIAWCHKYIASIYRRKNDYFNALEHYKKCIAIEEEIGNHLYTSYTYLSVVVLCCDMGIHNVSNYYLEKLENLNNLEKNKIIAAKFNLAFAYHLKHSNKLQNIAEAQRLFREVAIDTRLSKELTIFAITNLAELLIVELKLYGGEEVLEEVKVHAQNIVELSKNQESFSLLARAYGLLANLSLIELKLEESKHYLELGHKIAKERGLTRIQKNLEMQRESFDSEINKWTSFVSSSASFVERIDHSNVLEYIKLLEKDQSLQKKP